MAASSADIVSGATAFSAGSALAGWSAGFAAAFGTAVFATGVLGTVVLALGVFADRALVLAEDGGEAGSSLAAKPIAASAMKAEYTKAVRMGDLSFIPTACGRYVFFRFAEFQVPGAGAGAATTGVGDV